MPDGIVIWLVLGAVAAVVFFGVAAWAAVTGVADVRDLLHRHRPDDDR
ncbi:MAG TPA: hypothetical protein VD948_01770 [Rhodothermales bacterium]|nr:hypothetical protein [Rhodothermales bacterium]